MHIHIHTHMLEQLMKKGGQEFEKEQGGIWEGLGGGEGRGKWCDYILISKK